MAAQYVLQAVEAVPASALIPLDAIPLVDMPLDPESVAKEPLDAIASDGAPLLVVPNAASPSPEAPAADPDVEAPLAATPVDADTLEALSLDPSSSDDAPLELPASALDIRLALDPPHPDAAASNTDTRTEQPTFMTTDTSKRLVRCSLFIWPKLHSLVDNDHDATPAARAGQHTAAVSGSRT
jgi:hypothetical protein